MPAILDQTLLPWVEILQDAKRQEGPAPIVQPQQGPMKLLRVND